LANFFYQTIDREHQRGGSLMTIHDECASLYNRFSDPDRLCDECWDPPVGGEQRQFAIVEFPFGRLLYLICEQCAKTGTPKIKRKAEHIRDHFISDLAAAIMRLSSEETVN
jgi:hypothetical protein